MCYQTRLIKKREEIADRFNAVIEKFDEYSPTEFCSAFDYPKTPVITSKNTSKIQLYNWGLVPKYSQDISIRKFTLNARIETLNEKKSFKNVIQNRCLIIADGFYEWQWRNKSGSKKQKYLIGLPNNELFAFAGIYSQWTNYENSIYNSYSLITTKANDLMSEIHNTKQRMPVLLRKEDEINWLSGKNFNIYAYPYSCDIIASKINENNSNQLEFNFE